MQKLHSQLFKGNKENSQQQNRKQNYLERKRFIDYGNASDNNNLSGSSDSKEPVGKADKGKSNPTTVLGSSKNNKKLDIEDDEDEYGNDPWDMDDHKRVPAANKAEAVKANPFDQKVKPAFDDLEDMDDFKPNQKQAIAKKKEPQLSELLTA